MKHGLPHATTYVCFKATIPGGVSKVMFTPEEAATVPADLQVLEAP